MRAVLVQFQRSLDDLNALLARDSLEVRLLAHSEDKDLPDEVAELLRKYKLSIDPYSLSQAQYSMQLVLLYGAFERFIEGMIVETANALSSVVPEFNKLPLQIQENHRKKSIDALRDELWLSRQTDNTLSKRLIENLSTCESRSSNYSINSWAYARHSANYRRTLIDEAFRDLGVDRICEKTRWTSPYTDFIAALPAISKIAGDGLSTVDDLAERRNEIAHGSAMEVMGPQDLGTYLKYFEVFAAGLYMSLKNYLTRYLVEHRSLHVGPIAAVHYGKVAEIKASVLRQGTSLEVGDKIAAGFGSGDEFRLGTIESLRIEAGDVSMLRWSDGLHATIGTDLKLRDGHELYLIESSNATAASLAAPWP